MSTHKIKFKKEIADCLIKNAIKKTKWLLHSHERHDACIKLLVIFDFESDGIFVVKLANFNEGTSRIVINLLWGILNCYSGYYLNTL